MKYFDYLSEGDQHSLFAQPPAEFDKFTPRDTLRDAVGGLLYIPGVDKRIAEILVQGRVRGMASMAVCLEDAVGDGMRRQAMTNVVLQLDEVARALAEGRMDRARLPLIFVRVKDNAMLEEMAEFFVRRSDILAGVILPKVTAESMARALPVARDIARAGKAPFYAMPILENEEMMTCRDRIGLLHELRAVTDQYEEQILNIRIGATDLCGVLGLRRAPDTPIYCVAPVAACIADVVRVFGVHDRYTVSGPVWEYFSAISRAMAVGRWTEMEGLIHEVRLDQQNGVTGKTCVHPAQLLPVQAGLVVESETWQDATGILYGDQQRSGVLSSAGRNKMNELRPHALWARKVARRAGIYGVYQQNTDCAGFLRAVYGREYHESANLSN